MKVTPTHRAILSFALLAAIVVPSVAMASSYYNSLSFSVALRGTTRTYNSSNMNISMTASAPAHSLNKYFTVKLYRDGLLSDDYIGSSSFVRNGYDSARWTSVGSGKYYFRFEKANDGVTVTSPSVHMYSN